MKYKDAKMNSKQKILYTLVSDEEIQKYKQEDWIVVDLARERPDMSFEQRKIMAITMVEDNELL